MEKKKSVLVIDDSPTVRRLADLVLSEEGYDVFTAEDGEGGLEIARKEVPSVIIVDFIMPRMNGYQLCRNIRSDSILNDIPIVLITSKGEDVGQGFDEKFGIAQYLQKPFEAETLIRAVREALRVREEESRASSEDVATEATSEDAVTNTGTDSHMSLQADTLSSDIPFVEITNAEPRPVEDHATDTFSSDASAGKTQGAELPSPEHSPLAFTPMADDETVPTETSSSEDQPVASVDAASQEHAELLSPEDSPLASTPMAGDETVPTETSSSEDQPVTSVDAVSQEHAELPSPEHSALVSSPMADDETVPTETSSSEDEPVASVDAASQEHAELLSPEDSPLASTPMADDETVLTETSSSEAEPVASVDAASQEHAELLSSEDSHLAFTSMADVDTASTETPSREEEGITPVHVTLQENIEKEFRHYFGQELTVLLKNTMIQALKETDLVRSSRRILSGEIMYISIADVLQFISSSGLSGKLSVLTHNVNSEIYLEGGQIAFATISSPGYRTCLEELILKSVSPRRSEMLSAFSEARGNSLAAGSILLERGLITEDELTDYYRRLSEDAVHQTLSATSGHFFIEDTPLPQEIQNIKLRMPVNVLRG